MHLLSRWYIAASISLMPVATTPLGAELPEEWLSTVTDYVTEALAETGAPGAAVVIVDGDGVLFADGLGVSALGGDPVTLHTPFHLASVSKALTGLAVMQLVEAGRLDLDTPLGRSSLGLGWEDLPASEVAINNLLSHTSGWSENDGLVNRIDPDSGPDALAKNAQRIASTPVGHPLGQFEYSNANYDVLGYLIERASGQTFANYMKDHVFAPLAMTHSSASEPDAEAAGVAQGHFPFFGITSSHPLTFIPGSVPSSFLSASVSDLGNFLVANLNEGRFEGSSILSPAGMAIAQTPITHPSGSWDGYAMGWRVFPLWNAGRLTDGTDGGTAYEVPVILEHQGDHESFASSILLIPEHDLGIAVLLNMNDETVPSKYHQMHFGIASILLGAAPQPLISEDGLRRNAKTLALLIVGLFLLRAGLSAWRLNRVKEAHGRYEVVQHLAIPLVIDFILIATLWWYFLSESGVPLTLLRRSAPDLVLAAVAATAVGVSWAAARAIRVVRALRRPTPVLS